MPKVERNRLIVLLHACLDELEPAQKLVLQLRFWELLEIEQIALILESSWNHVDELLERTFRQLRMMLTERLRAEADAAKAA